MTGHHPGIRRTREPWRVLAAEVSPLPPGTPPARRLRPLLANLGCAAGTGELALWVPGRSPLVTCSPPAATQAGGDGGGWVCLLHCQGGPTGWNATGPWEGTAAPDPAAVPGSRLLLQLTDGTETLAAVTLHGGDPHGGDPHGGGGPGAVGPALLSATGDCLVLVLRELRLEQAVRSELARAERLEARLAFLGGELARVVEAERRRLAAAILAGPADELTEVRLRWQELVAATRADDLVPAPPRDVSPSPVPAGPAPAGASPVGAAPTGTLTALRRMRSALDQLVDDFRLVVRAVAPRTLRAQGPVAALAELAGQLPRRVRIVGDLGRRVGWEIEAGIYHAAAAALTVLAAPDSPSDGPADLVLSFARAGGRLVVRLTDPTPGPPDRIWVGLAEDARRLVALGGGLRHETGADGAGVVEIWLPEKLVPELDVPAVAGHQIGTVPVTAVPRPGSDRTVSVPPTEASRERRAPSVAPAEPPTPGPSSATMNDSPW